MLCIDCGNVCIISLFLHCLYIVFSSHQKSYVQYDNVMMFWKWFQKFPHMHFLGIFEVHFLSSIDVNDFLNSWCVGQGRAAAIFVTVAFLGFLSIAGFPAIVKEVKVSFLCELFVCSLLSHITKAILLVMLVGFGM